MEKPKRRRWWIWIILIFVCIAGLAVALLFLLSSRVTSAPPPKLTATLSIDTSKLASYHFNVKSNTDFMIRSLDDKAHNCMILVINKPVNIPAGQPSASLQLAPGEYMLNCGIPNINAKISSQ